MKSFRCFVACLLILAGIVFVRYLDGYKPEMIKYIEEVKAEEQINRVDLIRANFPSDWKPAYVYSEPGKICYPEVIERQKAEAKRAEQNALERYLAQREAERCR